MLSSVQLLFCCLFIFFLCKSLSLVLQDSAVSGSRKRKRVSRLFFFSFLSQGLEGCKCSFLVKGWRVVSAVVSAGWRVVSAGNIDLSYLEIPPKIGVDKKIYKVTKKDMRILKAF